MLLLEIFESELHVLEEIWKNEGITAKELAQALFERVGWSRTTTYTVISKCIEKEYVRREDPKYRCYSVLSRPDVQKNKVKSVLSNLFDNSVVHLFSAFAETQKLTESEKDQLRKIIDDME